MLSCSKCGALATPGATDCQKCGQLFTAQESEPERSKPERVVRWWLFLAGFLALVSIVQIIFALTGASLPEEVRIYLWLLLGAGLLRLAAVGVLLLWRRWGLYLYLLSALVYAALSASLAQALFALLAAAIMWFMVRKAWPSFR
jgi:hypothetical protein